MGGVAILIRTRADIGVTEPMLEYGENSHRLLGLKMVASSVPPMLLVSVYLKAAVGLNEPNRTL